MMALCIFAMYCSHYTGTGNGTGNQTRNDGFMYFCYVLFTLYRDRDGEQVHTHCPIPGHSPGCVPFPGSQSSAWETVPTKILVNFYFLHCNVKIHVPFYVQ